RAIQSGTPRRCVTQPEWLEENGRPSQRNCRSRQHFACPIRPQKFLPAPSQPPFVEQNSPAPTLSRLREQAEINDRSFPMASEEISQARQCRQEPCVQAAAP